jgi:predicted ATPase
VEGAKLPQGLTPIRIVISGCSGGGKSTLLAELARRGHRTFVEPGREIVKAELGSGGDALPWANVQRFAERCIALALEHIASSENEERAFFDRSLIDAVSALEHMKLPVPHAARHALEARPYASRVFMAPPWPELFANDTERRHSFENATAEYDRLLVSYKNHGHEIVLIPKQPLEQRATFILQSLPTPRSPRSSPADRCG